MIIVSGWNPLTIITKLSILDVAAVLDPLLLIIQINHLILNYITEALTILKNLYGGNLDFIKNRIKDAALVSFCNFDANAWQHFSNKEFETIKNCI